MTNSERSENVLMGVPAFFAGTLSAGLQSRTDAAKILPAQILLASTMIGLGIIGLVYGDFALVWQHIPISDLPGRKGFAYACAVIELATGLGLLVRPANKVAIRALFVYLVLWVLLSKLPGVIQVPQRVHSWSAIGEISVILSGGWALFATQAGQWERLHLKFAVGINGIRLARLLFALAVLTDGLSHFAYAPQTAAYVPAWLPMRLALAYLTGACSVAACGGILLGIYPRIAATLQALMFSGFTLLVWGPGIVTQPQSRLQWTAFMMSSAISAGAWVIAATYRSPERKAGT